MMSNILTGQQTGENSSQLLHISKLGGLRFFSQGTELQQSVMTS
uniref:Uncharacterized protein n=1 Tax=Anguilla anguilla TaxID=7936 RepID=A0A0E9TCT7_ANGAN